ncbi:MAG TPA: hypothetical protein O0X43_01530 [Methanocorpusculum sp.]|nr:hypothetical protein [Methanocorpusculum sp.]
MTYTDDEILAAAHKTMNQSGRTWVRASDIYLELLQVSHSSGIYHNRQQQIPGSRIYYVLRTHGFRRDTAGSLTRRNPKYIYTGGEKNGNGDGNPGNV